MEHGTGVTQRVTFDSPIGQLGLVVTPNGLRQVLLPRTARRSSANAAPAATANAAPTATANAAMANAPATTPRIADAVGQVLAYLRGERREFELPLDLTGVGTHMRPVLDELCARAPYGKVITYGELASWSGCPGGAREVGQIMARNPIPLVVPCHRVVAADGLGGYGGGLALKRRLLRLEGALAEQLSLIGDYQE